MSVAAMAKQAPKLWQTVIDDLRQVTRNPIELASLLATQRLGTITQQLEGMPVLPGATWKTLIDNKVPFKILDACKQPPRDQTAVGNPSAWLYALSVFLMGAAQSDIIPTSVPDAVSSTSLSIGQQLERAGFVQLLPAAIAALTEQLSDLQQRPGVIAKGLASKPSYQCMEAIQIMVIHTYLQQLMTVLKMIEHLWQPGHVKTRIVPALAVPFLHFLVVFMQHVSLCLEHLPSSSSSSRGGQDPPLELGCLTQQACAMAVGLIMPAVREVIIADAPLQSLEQRQQQQQQPQQKALQHIQQDLVLSPYTAKGTCLLMVMCAYASMLQHQKTAGSSSVTRESFSESWKLACERHHLLPAVHDDLLQAVGSSSKAVLFAAATAAALGPHCRISQTDTLKMMLYVYSGVTALKQGLLDEEALKEQLDFGSVLGGLGILQDSLSTGQAQQQQQQQQYMQWSPAEQRVHLLLPSVLLLHAAEAPSAGADVAEWGNLCSFAGFFGSEAVKAWKQQESMLMGALTRDSMQWALQLLGQRGASSSRSAQSPTQQFADAVADLRLVAAQVEEALHVGGLYLLPKLLGMIQAETSTSSSSSSDDRQSAEAASSSSDGQAGRHSKQHGSSSSSSTTHSTLDASVVGPHLAFQHVLNYLCEVGDTPAAHLKQRMVLIADSNKRAGVPTACLDVQAAAAAADVAAAWSQHAVQLCGSLEGYVRLQAARPDGGSLGLYDGGLAMLCSSRVVGTTQWHNGGLLQAALAAGPGSEQQARLFSLLCSLLKFTSSLTAQRVGLLTDAVLSAALAAASILQGSTCVGHTAANPAAATATPAAAAAAARSDPAAANATPEQSVGHMLPWLVLLGRCCSRWADQLLQGAVGQHPQGNKSAYLFRMQPYTSLVDVFTQPVVSMTEVLRLSEVMAASITAGTAGKQGSGAAATLSDGCSSSSSSQGPSTVPVGCLEACRSWLSMPNISAQLTAAGYDTAALNTQLDAALQAAAAAGASAAGVGLAELLVHLAQQLHGVGKALSTLAISSACNNPACSNTSGPSEAGLVKGSSSTCGGCRMARYCSKACQGQHWKLHKQICKAMAAARAGGVP